VALCCLSVLSVSSMEPTVSADGKNKLALRWYNDSRYEG
jgi:hypothetical protein